ncbi:hypothetical protein B0H14DRAFT_1584065 [Mycena olivaceomarginata]|nr:hypothetical protein B0H14DRAFT_1584065 [Mycena olivaceomarginata]
MRLHGHWLLLEDLNSFSICLTCAFLLNGIFQNQRWCAQDLSESSPQNFQIVNLTLNLTSYRRHSFRPTLPPTHEMYNTVEPKVFIIQSAEHRRRRIDDLSWLNVTRVSSQWRKVALACPDFWSTPIFSRPKWTPVMLARSKMASLVVRVDLAEDQANSPEPILLENASRLGTLDIRSPQHQLTIFLANLEQADAACRLQDIKVVNTDADSLGHVARRKSISQNTSIGEQENGNAPGCSITSPTLRVSVGLGVVLPSDTSSFGGHWLKPEPSNGSVLDHPPRLSKP